MLLFSQQDAPSDKNVEKLETELKQIESEKSKLQEQNEKAKKIVKAQQLKSKKLLDENDQLKKADLEWEGLSNNLRAQIDQLTAEKEIVESENKEIEFIR